MEKFNYKLQNVLDYKIEVEEKKKRLFVKILKKYMMQEKKLNELKDKKITAERGRNDIKNGIDCISFSRYINYLEKTIESESQNLLKINEELEKAKCDFIKSASDRKILEKLKEIAKQEFEIEENKKEQKLNDDYALFSYVRNERR